jgi:class 3 adenylate cyclase
MAAPDVHAGPRTFLFADLRGYTAYVEKHGDVSAAALLARYREIVRAAVADHGGAEVKTEGDSFYVVFDSSVAAVRCAMAVQQEAAAEGRPGLDIGIGLHAGETVAFETQYVGSAVNVAARLAAAASAGEVLVSETVRSLIRTALPVAFDSRGALAL